MQVYVYLFKGTTPIMETLSFADLIATHLFILILNLGAIIFCVAIRSASQLGTPTLV